MHSWIVAALIKLCLSKISVTQLVCIHNLWMLTLRYGRSLNPHYILDWSHQWTVTVWAESKPVDDWSPVCWSLVVHEHTAWIQAVITGTGLKIQFCCTRSTVRGLELNCMVTPGTVILFWGSLCSCHWHRKIMGPNQDPITSHVYTHLLYFYSLYWALFYSLLTITNVHESSKLLNKTNFM